MPAEIFVSPWQVFSWAGEEVNIFIPKDYEFKTIRLAEEYDIMQPGDLVEFIRMADMRKLGEAVVISTKRTLVKFLREDDVADFRRVVVGANSHDLIVDVLAKYYEQPLTEDKPVVVLHLKTVKPIASSAGTMPYHMVGSNPPVNTGSMRALIRSQVTSPIVRGI